MLDLAMANRAETFERLREPMAERGISLVHCDPTERTLPLAPDAAPFGPDDADVGWVYPGRTQEGDVLSAALDVPWVNGREAVLTSRNKAGVLARLAAAGLPVPETTAVSNPADDEAVLAAADRIGYPVVVKPNSTTRGIGVAKASDPDTLLGVTDYLDLVHDYRATGDKTYLLQAYVPDATDYRVMVVDGEYAGAVERRLPDEAVAEGRWKHNVHRGAEARGVDLDPDLRRLTERVAAELGVDLLGVDLLVDGDGRAVVGETNARPTVDAATKYEAGFYDGLAALIRSRANGEE